MTRENLGAAVSEKASKAIKDLQQAVSRNESAFVVLMEATKYCSLGQLTQAMFEVGGSTGGICDWYMKGALMSLVHLTLVVVGLALVLVWFMYSAGVHGTFRFRWLEWENWIMLLGILLCFGIPANAMYRTRTKGA